MQDHLIIGTMGHIDHGKTSLIAALNGFFGDELKEEKERGITLDLSFSNLTLGDRNIAFIDVPGHEKLIKNMIAGAFGIDYAMLVIAANEGIMPQTLEHFKIAKILGIQKFLVVLTKVDLIDQKTLNSLEKEVEKLFLDFKNATFSILYFSIYDKQSVQILKETLYNLKKVEKKELEYFRYYIDRAFSIKGAGCVVSGTLLDGSLNLEDKIWCCNLNRALGIKSIQNHNQNVTSAKAGQRIALNLSGVNANELKRGDLLSKKGYLRSFDIIEAKLELFAPLEHNSSVQLYIGALRCECRVLFLDKEKNFATLKLDKPIFSVFSQKFILRDDKQTLGGGSILAPIADPLKKSQKLDFLNALNQNDLEGAFKILLQAHKKGFGIISSMQRFGISQNQALKIAEKLEDIFIDPKELILYPSVTKKIVENIVLKILEKNKNALLSASLLSQKQSWISKSFAQSILDILEKKGILRKADSFYVGKDFLAKNVKDYLYEQIFEKIKNQGYEPIAPYNLYDMLDIDRQSGDEVYKRLTKEKKILRLSHKLFIETHTLSKLLEKMRQIIKDEGYLDLNNFKNHFNLSRKYLITYLDYLDSFEDICNTNGKRTFKGKIC
ncbi:selenocysteine-specific translation elongation factor [Helicobacter valdiviensis]|uniref:Selenocysteine-specific elongation factor n=1 Tax=Helicobacter valdiviensis TaxID=1458358 RepID=A0A2W6MW99_9HELI|nr:selenocysteine-specific translation elongation factor [Helicobacter valdiviensis]PZT48239.1 selenocysteine-specific translation elongation factor [Helicobacter valdiviensis]